MNARVVSLVPSATETLIALGVRPIACTRFCDAPGIRSVGGTKDPDVAAVIDLAPDLVVVNDEENRREDADALGAAGLSVHSMSPRAVADVVPAVDALAAVLGIASLSLPISRPVAARGTAVTFVWRRPWMTQSDDTFGASLLAHLGWVNPFAGDVTRYPVTDLTSVQNRSPDVIVLPSEPYPFAHRHVAEVTAAIPASRILVVDGRDLFWWGARTPAALVRLGTSLH
jgi:ABC-type Fe3+-hydroxamate transport system substrate-binding protein